MNSWKEVFADMCRTAINRDDWMSYALFDLRVDCSKEEVIQAFEEYFGESFYGLR